VLARLLKGTKLAKVLGETENGQSTGVRSLPPVG
jgi:hypothetical protein